MSVQSVSCFLTLVLLCMGGLISSIFALLEVLTELLIASEASCIYLSTLLPVNLTLFVRTRNILDDFREAYYWLRQNTEENARVMSWWDYGYQIAGMANRTTLVDNNTWNNSHIALVSLMPV